MACSSDVLGSGEDRQGLVRTVRVHLLNRSGDHQKAAGRAVRSLGDTRLSCSFQPTSGPCHLTASHQKEAQPEGTAARALGFSGFEMCGEGALVQRDAVVVVSREVCGSREQIEVVRGQGGECVGPAESVQGTWPLARAERCPRVVQDRRPAHVRSRDRAPPTPADCDPTPADTKGRRCARGSRRSHARQDDRHQSRNEIRGRRADRLG